MAKAQTKPTIYAWPRDIYSLVLEICGSPEYCGPWLVEQIVAGRVRWRPMPPFPSEPLDDFWYGEGAPPKIDFAKCTATKMVVHPTESTLCSIKLVFQIVPKDIEDIAIRDGLIAPPTSEVEPTKAQSIATETESITETEPLTLAAKKIIATRKFLKDQHTLMKEAGRGFPEREKEVIGRELHLLLKNAARTNHDLKSWEARSIVLRMNENGLW